MKFACPVALSTCLFTSPLTLWSSSLGSIFSIWKTWEAHIQDFNPYQVGVIWKSEEIGPGWEFPLAYWLRPKGPLINGMKFISSRSNVRVSLRIPSLSRTQNDSSKHQRDQTQLIIHRERGIERAQPAEKSSIDVDDSPFSFRKLAQSSPTENMSLVDKCILLKFPE